MLKYFIALVILLFAFESYAGVDGGAIKARDTYLQSPKHHIK